MYIIRTQTRVYKAKPYYSYRMVDSMRDCNNKVKQRTLLNLGANYQTIPESDHVLLSERVDDIIRGQGVLIPLREELETEAQRLCCIYKKE